MKNAKELMLEYTAFSFWNSRLQTGAARHHLRLPALRLRVDPHGFVKQIRHEALEDSDKERPSAFPRIVLIQPDSGIQQLHGPGERTQEQQRGRCALVD